MNRTILSRQDLMDSLSRRRLASALVAVFCFVAPPARGQTPVSGRDQGFVPYSEEPIRYLSDRVNDPVARLQDRIDRGLARLDFEAGHGYLQSVLKQLDVDVSSQTLVFSKSSFQYRKISPQTPRALYYNDNVYVGWVKDGHSLEIASFDPDQGAIFYLLEQQPSDQPAFVRATLDCTFEEPEQQEDGLTRARAFIKKYGVQYTYLIAGSPVEMWEKVPQAVNLNSWPTTFFIGRDGRVKKIHAGFASPASGAFHDQVTEEFASTVERLLAENATASR